jgi:hypothetical protein
LRDGRFQVTATWETSQGSSGAAQVVKLSDETGTLWFFDASNVEAIVKLLDGCALNQRFWVFAAGLTNVRVVLRVVDTATGLERSYTNPPGHAFVPIQDTGTFATCP